MNGPSEALLEAIAACACEVTGFSRDAIGTRALQRALTAAMRDGLLASDVMEAARRRSDVLVARVVESVAVCETYFFRNPDQLEALADAALERALGNGATRVSAWSAGCATGEEAWSLAALLRSRLPASLPFEVVGSDLLPANIRTARAGEYGAWSVRQAGRGSPGAYVSLPEGRVRVEETLRPAVRFEVGNLLEGGVSGLFDVVACRNVLVYFSEPARQRALRSIRNAVRPGGLLALGAMDVEGVPDGFVREGAAELQLYRREVLDEVPPPAVRVAPPVRVKPAAPPVAPLRPTPVVVPPLARPAAPPEPPTWSEPPLPPVLRHLEALLLLDRGEEEEARRLLLDLAKSAPDYIPGHLELALLLGREGATGPGSGVVEAARRVQLLASRLAPDALVDGPEPLSASFYLEAAERLLARREVRS